MDERERERERGQEKGDDISRNGFLMIDKDN